MDLVLETEQVLELDPALEWDLDPFLELEPEFLKILLGKKELEVVVSEVNWHQMTRPLQFSAMTVMNSATNIANSVA